MASALFAVRVMPNVQDVVTLPSPNLKLKRRISAVQDMIDMGHTSESQEPVHKLIPSLLTPKQLTRFSCPLSEPTLSPRSVSQT